MSHGKCTKAKATFTACNTERDANVGSGTDLFRFLVGLFEEKSNAKAYDIFERFHSADLIKGTLLEQLLLLL